MADDPKQSHAAPPFAYKGAARPLARARPGDSEAAGVREERRPSGLHTRPDLFGSSAVMAKPADSPVEDSDETEPPQSAQTAPYASSEERPCEAGTASPDEAQPGAPAPAANLLDHPVRIPESISFEDWPDDSDLEPEDGARSAHVAEPAAAEPEPRKSPAPPSAEGPREEMAAARGPTYAPPPAREPEEPADRLGALLARFDKFDKEAVTRRLREQRWPLALGAVSCAALLVAGLVGGIVPLGGDERETTQVAEGLDTPTTGHSLPASEDLAGPSESESQDMTMAPAGNAFGPDPQMSQSPAQSDTASTDSLDGGSQLAALPEARGPEALDGDREPIVDFMRIDPDGKAVVAGRAAPGTELIVLDNGEPLGTITADIYGLWTFVSPDPLADGRHEIGLRVKRQGSEITNPTLVTDSGSAVPPAPAPVADAQDSMAAESMAEESSLANLPAPEQLAAVEPETPVQSDQSPPLSGTGTEETVESAEAASAVSEPAQATEEQGGESAAAAAQQIQAQPTEAQATEVQTAEAQPAADATSSAAAPTPAPKPEPPAQTQTAALPADGDFVIQLASFKNPDMAAREQATVEERFADLLAGHEVFVQKADLGEQGTYYRVRLGPFASLDDARATCSRFQERDRDCLAMAR